MQTFFWIIGIAVVAILLGLLAMNVALWWAKRGSDGKGR
jgi:general stress protein CsbA